jgi:trimeric autotransporter adhesin
MRLSSVVPVAFVAALVSPGSASGQSYTISAFAGSLRAPNSVAVDKSGNVFFVDNISVLRLDGKTGVLTLVAGNSTGIDGGDNGPATGARLSRPTGVALDSAGNVYIADNDGSRIRKVSNGVITTVAGNGVSGESGDNGPATSAELLDPAAVAVDVAGNLYIAELFRIREVSNGTITTVAGSGGPAGTNVMLSGPSGLAVDSVGNLYIADTGNDVVRRLAGGVLTTVAGNGTMGYSGDDSSATTARLNLPRGVAVDSAGNLYIADTGNSRIRKVINGVITTVAGNGTPGFSGDSGPARAAQLTAPWGVAVDSAGNLYITDNLSAAVRKVANGVITTVAGIGISLGEYGPPSSRPLLEPVAVAVDVVDGALYIADPGSQSILEDPYGSISTFAGNGTQGFSGDNGPAASAQLSNPQGLAKAILGPVYIADSGNQRVRMVSNGVITTVAGNGVGGFSGDSGPATSARLSNPQGLAVDGLRDLYIADSGNQRVREVFDGGIINTAAGNGTQGFSGDGGPARDAELSLPAGLAFDPDSNLFIADSGNNRIRKVSSDGVITTVAGNGTPGFAGDNGPATSAELSNPRGVAVDYYGNLFIADSGNNRIRKVSNGVITTVAGIGTFGTSGDNGPAVIAELSNPYGVAVDYPAGDIYLTDAARIRALTPDNTPAILYRGIVPVYSSVPVIQSGSWVSIYGKNLAVGTFTWNGDFPTSLGGTSVTIDNKAAYLWYANTGQINLQVPDDAATGPVSVVVSTPAGMTTSSVTLAPYGPSFSMLSDARHVIGEIATPDGSGAYGAGSYDLVGPSGTFSFSTRPVKAGETLVLYGVGFGPTTPSVPAGKIFSGSAPVDNPVTITIGGVPANVVFGGITEAGLYQFNLTVPPNTGSGDQALLATTVNGAQTPLGVVVAVQ